MEWNFGMVAMFILGFVVLYILMWIFIKPVKLALRLVVNSVIGALLLILFNYIGGMWNFTIGVNIYTALTCGLLGIPGFILLILLKLIYGI